jgi:hypothetical protein
MTKGKLPPSLQDWIVARKRHHLSHAQVQMARELGMNPRKLGKLDNHRQEPWKAPLPQFIEALYLKRFGRERPDLVVSIEERARAHAAKREARKEARRQARAQGLLGDRRPTVLPSNDESPRDGNGISEVPDAAPGNLDADPAQ